MIIDDFDKLSQPGLLGFYTSFEVTEIFIIKGQSSPLNLFTIIVGDESCPIQSAAFLTKKLINLKRTNGWKLGIKRTWLDRKQMLNVLRCWQNDGIWRLDQNELSIGILRKLEPHFVPADGHSVKPWNRILKNNFWNGSYILELADNEKAPFAQLFAKPTALQELAEKILEILPIDLAGLSDRLGNIVIQLPVRAVTSSMVSHEGKHALHFHNTWNSLAVSRRLRVAVEAYSEDAIMGYSSALVDTSETPLPFPMDSQSHRWWLWDDRNGVLLGASSECSFISSVSFAMNMVTDQKRQWTLPAKVGTPVPVEISVNQPREPSVIGEPRLDANGWHTRFRIYREESKAAAKALRFVQYGGAISDRNAEQARALEDLRTLISRHGAKGVWLWDPYLSGTDVLNTLFFAPTIGAELRGLTAGRVVPIDKPNRKGTIFRLIKWGVRKLPFFGKVDDPISRLQRWINAERLVLQSNGSNAADLNLTFRISYGSNAFPFHDRFLIFPQTEQGALAWSLGTSVNAFGRQHHILQQVGDGQLIADAFEHLWNQLSDPQHHVWSCS